MSRFDQIPDGPGTLTRQQAIYRGGLAGHRPDLPIDPDALERAAEAQMTPEAFAYIAGGAGCERTMAANRAAFDRRRIVPRMLAGIAESDAFAASLIARAEACDCSALVVTLDTPLLGWRPRDLALGHLPFLSGQGLAQYTSDPVFQSMLDDLAADFELSPALSGPRSVAELQTGEIDLQSVPGD